MNIRQFKILIKECISEVLNEADDYDRPEGSAALKQIHHKNIIGSLSYFVEEYIKTALFSSTGPSPEDLETQKQSRSETPPETKSLYHPNYDSDDFDIDDNDDNNNTESELPEHPLDDHYTIRNIDIETIERMKRDCNDFYNKFSEYYHAHGWNDDRAAHDFWLTRNGHGAGFWSRTPDELDSELYHGKSDDEIETAGEVLTKASKKYGEFNLYVGNDGLIHGS